MSESNSVEERAGDGPYPYVELRPKSPPLQITEAGPLPPPPPAPPFVRAAALTDLQTAFALLSDDELQVARQRMLGIHLEDIGEDLGLGDEEVEKLWKQARRKLGNAIFGKK
jgi:DNA-directed RNA polymerase specialized sigma24 family protein